MPKDDAMLKCVKCGLVFDLTLGYYDFASGAECTECGDKTAGDRLFKMPEID